MPEFLPSRRQALKSLGGALVAGAFGLREPATAAEDAAGGKGIVDTHVHIVSSKLGRAIGKETPLPEPFNMQLEPGGPERFARLLEAELQAAGVEHALCMPCAHVSDADPLGIAPTLAQAKLVRGVKLHPIGIAHPERFDREHLAKVERVLDEGVVKAFKCYLGYLHYDPTSPSYRRYYRLAAKYNVPVILHTGDTYSPAAKVKLAHPLAIDELAVDFPDTKFVLAHFGNPWIMDAAEVVYKNANVWADLSAFLIGDERNFKRMNEEGVVEKTAQRVKQAIDFAETTEKFVFGSDWPLAPIAAYRDVVRQFFPAEEHEDVFSANARKLFRLT